MKAGTRQGRSDTAAKSKRQAKTSRDTERKQARRKRKGPRRPRVNRISNEDFHYLFERLSRLWFRRGRRLDAEDLAQIGALKAWFKQCKHKGKNGASLRTYSYKVGDNAGRSALRKLNHREELEHEEEHERAIVEMFGEKVDSGLDSGCYRIVGEKRIPIFREPVRDFEEPTL